MRHYSIKFRSEYGDKEQTFLLISRRWEDIAKRFEYQPNKRIESRHFVGLTHEQAIRENITLYLFKSRYEVDFNYQQLNLINGHTCSSRNVKKLDRICVTDHSDKRTFISLFEVLTTKECDNALQAFYKSYGQLSERSKKELLSNRHKKALLENLLTSHIGSSPKHCLLFFYGSDFIDSLAEQEPAVKFDAQVYWLSLACFYLGEHVHPEGIRINKKYREALTEQPLPFENNNRGKLRFFPQANKAVATTRILPEEHSASNLHSLHSSF
ncbi:hypothetical protein [Legionella shakespearei]|uniref:Uncharacterized protein n=1 Tax=Legionella shakespearei DSM 23087 TaxID=1122169 RepID=A0A0W0YQC4_9GAMM|nr:hypothetical protein [Legionella shakespearei]KTD58895.1 hypothetical protein Lsha_2113 [Legionella shakespearei DSM 23087]